ncbi:MAG TPA: LamG domain-containing protein [Lacipirellulaceae bacterium]|jgi:hypothetical protein|nr:LamG domain-containing protein [Lacipirellulaceae bacterium]
MTELKSVSTMVPKPFRARRFSIIAAASIVVCAGSAFGADRGLVGYWPLAGDCRDHSGRGNDGTNYNVDLRTSEFNGTDSYIEIPDSSSLQLEKGDFSIIAEIYTQDVVDDVLGDVLSKFDGARRRGFNLAFTSNTSGYNSQSYSRLLSFGLDDDTTGRWMDCGRPGGKSHCSDALTVFEGHLYVGTVDAPEEADWAHVYRYEGGQNWEDCGRVGVGRTRGVYAMVVHDGALYAATAGPHGGPDVNRGDYGRVYRYRGGQQWDDIGQPGAHYRINSLASFQGKLYALSINTGGSDGGVYVFEGGREWKQCGDFGRPHTSGVHNGRLYAAYPQGEVFAYDGNSWDKLGNPLSSIDECNQIHSQGVFGGELYFGTWPRGKVAKRRGNEWRDMGRLGDATEVVGLSVYNGSLYAGTIPRAELFRFDGPHKWTSIRRLFDPANFDAAKDVEDWTRASSLTVYDGSLFVSTATCYRAMIDPPRSDEVRGKVFSFTTGANASLDRDLGPGWKHVAAVRERGTLKLHIDGQLAVSNACEADQLDVSNESPLRIGFGPQSHFRGKIREVRLYDRALNGDEIQQLQHGTRTSSVSTSLRRPSETLP